MSFLTEMKSQFPVMRRLSISSGHAFLLVYSITCPSSIQLVQTRLEEIKQQRKDFKVGKSVFKCVSSFTTSACSIAQDVPIVIAGNKVDQADEGREIFVEDVKDWVDQEYKQNRLDTWTEIGVQTKTNQISHNYIEEQGKLFIFAECLCSNALL